MSCKVTDVKIGLNDSILYKDIQSSTDNKRLALSSYLNAQSKEFKDSFDAILDSNGEPKVFYVGSDYIYKHFTADNLTEGILYTDRAIAKRNHNNIYPVYLRNRDISIINNGTKLSTLSEGDIRSIFNGKGSALGNQVFFADVPESPSDDNAHRNKLSSINARENLIGYLSEKITAFKNLQAIYKNSNSTIANEIDMVNRELKTVTGTELKEFTEDTIVKVLALDVDFTDNSLASVNAIVNRYKDFDFATIINDEKALIKFRDEARRVQSFIDLLQNVDTLSEIYSPHGSFLTSQEKDINRYINDLIVLQNEMHKLLNDFDFVIKKFFTARTIQFSKHPNFKKYKNNPIFGSAEEHMNMINEIYTNNEDITRSMLYLDTPFETGITFIDNLTQRYIVYRGRYKDQAREGVKEFYNKFTAIYGEDAISHKHSDKIAQWFKDKFIEKTKEGKLTNKLISEHRWTKYDEDRREMLSEYFTILNKAKVAKRKGQELRAKELRLQANQFRRVWSREHESTIRLTNSEEIVILNKKDSLPIEIFNRYLTMNNFMLDSQSNRYVRTVPNAKFYKNDEYDSLTKEEKEFRNYIASTISKYMETVENFPVNERFIPTLLDKDARSNLESIMLYLGIKDQYRNNPGEFVGLNNEIVNIIDIPFLRTLKEQELIYVSPREEKEDADVYEARVLDEVEKDTGVRYEKLTDIFAENDKRRESNIEYDVKNRSYNIFDIMTSFIEGMSKYKQEKIFEDELLLGQRELRDKIEFFSRRTGNRKLINKIKKSQFTGKDEHHTMLGRDSNAYKQLEGWINSMFYGKKPDPTTLDKIIKPLLQYTSMRTMMVNVTAGVKNVFKGYTDMMMEAGASEFISKEDLAWATKAYSNNVPKDVFANRGTPLSNTLEGAIAKRYVDLLELKDERGGVQIKDVRNVVDKVLIYADAMYFANNMGEHFMQYTMLLANMKSHRIVDGMIKSYQDYIGDFREDIVRKHLTKDQIADLDQYIARRKKEEQYPTMYNDYLSDWLSAKRFEGNLSKEQTEAYQKEFKEFKVDAKKEFEKNQTVYDNFELKDGFATLKEDTSIDNDDLNLFIRRVQRINHTMHGVYNTIDKNRLQYQLWGDALFQFRKWMRPNWNRYFGQRAGKTTFSESLGVWTSGAYMDFRNFLLIPSKNNPLGIFKEKDEDTTIVEAFTNLVKDYGKFISNIKLHYNDLNEHQKSNIRRSLVSMTNIVVMGLAVWGIGAFLQGDDDRKDVLAYNLMLYEANAIYMEVSEFVPIVGWVGTINRFYKYPFATYKSGLDLFKLMQNLFLYPFRTEEERQFQGGANRGKDKLTNDIEKSIPIYKEFYKIKNIPDYVSFYNMHNPLLFWK